MFVNLTASSLANDAHFLAVNDVLCDVYTLDQYCLLHGQQTVHEADKASQYISVVAVILTASFSAKNMGLDICFAN